MDTSCYELAWLIHSGVGELAMRGTRPNWTAILRHGETYSAVAVVLMMWGHVPQFVPCSFPWRLFRDESFAQVFR